MKIINLLNKIANGEEVPEKIKFHNCYCYYRPIKNQYVDFKNEPILEWNYIVMNSLNDEVEILEEEKKIPEKLPEEIIVGKRQPTHRIKKIEKKINEIISYLDYLKNKGDE